MTRNLNQAGEMEAPSQREQKLKQLLDLHAIDEEIRELKKELRRLQGEVESTEEGVSGLAANLEKTEEALERARAEARQAERAVEEKRDHLNRLRSRVNQVKTEKQYGAATLEFDLVKHDLRKLEERAIEKLEVIDDLEERRKGMGAALEEARSEAGPQRERADVSRKELKERLAILEDRRNNLSIRLDDSLLSLYDRIRAGRSEVAMAPLTEEAACGNCFTSVTVQQEMQIRGMSTIVCCEGCGVILHPRGLKI